MDSPRIEDLKRRIQRDPASIAFAQLAEEFRRSGRTHEAIEICRDGLKHHPGYLSARVTLGRALLDTGDLEQAERELKEVLRLAPENLAALRGVAEALGRRGDEAAALAHYEIALALAPRDLELHHTVASLREQVRHAPPDAPAGPSVAPAPPQAPAPPPEAAPTTAPQEVPSEAAVAPPPEALPETPPVLSPQTPAVLPVLERWLVAIVADRDERRSRTSVDGTSATC